MQFTELFHQSKKNIDYQQVNRLQIRQ